MAWLTARVIADLDMTFKEFHSNVVIVSIIQEDAIVFCSGHLKETRRGFQMKTICQAFMHYVLDETKNKQALVLLNLSVWNAYYGFILKIVSLYVQKQHWLAS